MAKVLLTLEEFNLIFEDKNQEYERIHVYDKLKLTTGPKAFHDDLKIGVFKHLPTGKFFAVFNDLYSSAGKIEVNKIGSIKDTLIFQEKIEYTKEYLKSIKELKNKDKK